MTVINSATEHLCVSCGICCDGPLFDYAKLLPEEVPHARELGFEIVQLGEHSAFALPCGNLCGTVCQIYEVRPSRCRSYKCTTVEAMENGEIDRAEADRRVEATKVAVADVRKRLLPGETFLELRARFGDDPSPAPDFRLAMVKWDMTMDRYFRKPHQQVFGTGQDNRIRRRA